MWRFVRIAAGVIGGLALLGIATALLLVTHDSACRAPPALAAGTARMQAIVYRCYGAPSVVRLERVAKPQPEPGRVLVKIATASVNALDWHYLKGEPYFMRFMSGLGAPDDVRLGVDFAGTVEAVGAGVERFRPGDRVFGGIDGAFAEYATAREQGSLALIPAGISFDQAAAVPIAAVTALQALRDTGRVQPGQRVLINGASGGVGTFAVQIAKLLGARVTGVCSGRNAELVRSLGAEQVVDYTREDFTTLPARYDLIIDIVGSHPLREYQRVLNPHGAVVVVGGITCGLCLGPLVSWLHDSLVSSVSPHKRLSILAQLNAADLETLGAWMGEGKLHAAIDRSYALAETPAALAYLEAGHARAKVLVHVAASPDDAEGSP